IQEDISEKKAAQNISKNRINSNRSARKQLIDLYHNKAKYNTKSLSALITKIESQNNYSNNIIPDLKRVKHNLEISRKIAVLSKNIIISKGEVKEVDPNVLKSIIALQKQLKVVQIDLSGDNS
ncbi:MAG: hypothetical protein L3J52_09770, partial [Proteobacteria bacterium]|nr:hypothetical protein [Pseudomonadota bacterium]